MFHNLLNDLLSIDTLVVSQFLPIKHYSNEHPYSYIPYTYVSISVAQIWVSCYIRNMYKQKRLTKKNS